MAGTAAPRNLGGNQYCVSKQGEKQIKVTYGKTEIKAGTEDEKDGHSDYASACNYKGAKIEGIIEVEDNYVELKSLVGYERSTNGHKSETESLQGTWTQGENDRRGF